MSDSRDKGMGGGGRANAHLGAVSNGPAAKALDVVGFAGSSAPAAAACARFAAQIACLAARFAAVFALPLRCAVSGDIPFKMASLCSTSAARSSSSRALVRSTNASTVTSAALTVGAVPRLGSVLPRDDALDAGGGASNAR